MPFKQRRPLRDVGPSLKYPSKKEVLVEMSDAGVQGLSHVKWAEIQGVARSLQHSMKEAGRLMFSRHRPPAIKKRACVSYCFYYFILN